MTPKHLFTLALCLLFCSCTEPDTPGTEQPRTTTVQASEISLAAYYAGKELYMTHCFFCHGEKADGQGALALSMEGPQPRNFTIPELAKEHPDSLKRVILDGGEAFGLSGNMPAWAGTISPTEAELLVAFIQMVSTKGGLLPDPNETLNLTDIPQESQPTY